MKNNKYYHSSISVKDYEFEYISVKNYDMKTLRNIVNIFNNSLDIIEKQNISKLLPNNVFPTCRICGSKIVNLNFKLKLNKFGIKLYRPEIYCREIDGVKYYISCCEKCLLEHFKNDPPKSQKYYFMRANKYGMYSFGYSWDEYKKICSSTVAVTKNSMIRKWGEKIGSKKWEAYCKKQKESNSFKYKHKKYGWTKQQFDDFNKSRAVTLKNMCKKYGEDIGAKKFNEYIKKQQLTKSYDYMVEKYGIDKANEINLSKAITLTNLINKYGETIGKEKYFSYINKHKNFYSKISQDFFDKLDKYLSKKYTTYYATKNTEYGVMLPDKTYICLDYFIKELNTCIEFNGTVFHGDLRVFNEDDYCNPFNKKLTVKQIHENDNNRIKTLETLGIKTITVWEIDYNKDIDIVDFIKTKLNIEL